MYLFVLIASQDVAEELARSAFVDNSLEEDDNVRYVRAVCKCAAN
jgi:hypothetical protein